VKFITSHVHAVCLRWSSDLKDTVVAFLAVNFFYLACPCCLPEMAVRSGRCGYHRCRPESSHFVPLCLIPSDGLGYFRIQISPFLYCISLLCTSALCVWDAHESQTI
jgi:hypothetical protein